MGADGLVLIVFQSERWNEPADGHDTTGQYDPQFHSSDGFIGGSLPGFPEGIDDMVIETTKQLPEFPYVLDINSGHHLGTGRIGLPATQS